MIQSFANITQMVYDFLVVEITEPSFRDQNHYFDYSIRSHDTKPVRKGRFFGTNVQLRLSQIEEGNYFLDLFSDDGTCRHFSFVKKSSAVFAGL
jgi:hypothetical protein